MRFFVNSHSLLEKLEYHLISPDGKLYLNIAQGVMEINSSKAVTTCLLTERESHSIQAALSLPSLYKALQHTPNQPVTLDLHFEGSTLPQKLYGVDRAGQMVEISL